MKFKRIVPFSPSIQRPSAGFLHRWVYMVHSSVVAVWYIWFTALLLLYGIYGSQLCCCCMVYMVHSSVVAVWYIWFTALLLLHGIYGSQLCCCCVKGQDADTCSRCQKLCGMWWPTKHVGSVSWRCTCVCYSGRTWRHRATCRISWRKRCQLLKRWAVGCFFLLTVLALSLYSSCFVTLLTAVWPWIM